MRIGLVRSRYVPTGGAERVMADLARAFAEDGHQVHLFAREWPEAPRGEGAAGGAARVTCHRVPVPPGPRFARVLAFAWGATRRLEAHALDATLSFERILRADVYRAGDGCHREWLRQRGRDRTGWGRGLDRVNPLHVTLLALERRLLARGGCRRIIANSRMVRDDILRHYGAPAAAVRLVYNGVALERFSPAARERWRGEVRRQLGRAEADLLLLFVGSGFERKGLDCLIRGLAAAAAADPALARAWVVVAGQGDPGPHRRLARARGLDQRILFLGPSARVERLYAACDGLALPTRYDPFANTCLEAMACGLPVLTSAANGAAELVAAAGAGLVVGEPRDAAEVGRAIRALADPGLRARMGRAGREVALEHPTRRQAAETLAVLREVWHDTRKG
jgi:UDP-glucose:(heptosyl)LPS alpha-1,3-glucosyltransferase